MLGQTLAGSLQELRGKDAVIFCIKESSLLTCLSMAKLLHAWVYPLVYEPVYSRASGGLPRGVVVENGYTAFDAVDNNENSPLDGATSEQYLNAVRQRLSEYDMVLDKHVMDGRHVIIACDVLIDTVPVRAALRYLEALRPKSLTAAIGNASHEAADLIRISADKTLILDVLSGVLFDDDHYFQQPDKYTAKEQRTLTRHIETYWQ